MKNKKFKQSPYNRQEKVKKIILTLRKNKEGLNPKTLSYLSGINYSTTRGLLRKNLPGISKKGGFYYYVENDTQRGLFDWTLQNVFIVCKIESYDKAGIRKYFGDEEITKGIFTVSSITKKACLHISAKYPLNLSSIYFFSSMFKLLVEKNTQIEIEEKDITISTLEFQKDFKNLRLDGYNSISLTNLLSQFKLYNKKGYLRLEHKITAPISPKVLLTLLDSETKSIDMLNEIHFLKEKVRKIENSIKRFGGLFQKFLDRADGRHI